MPGIQLSAHRRSGSAILKAVLRLCLAFENFLLFINRPHVRRSVATCDFLKAAKSRLGSEQLELGHFCPS
jgi:hypothetical protein